MAPPKAKNPRKTAQYYRDNPEAREKKDDYNKKYNRKEDQMDKRRELSRERYKRGIDGKGGDDMSHTKDGKIVAEDPSTNRARNRGKK
jgi:hypothetical protein